MFKGDGVRVTSCDAASKCEREGWVTLTKHSDYYQYLTASAAGRAVGLCKTEPVLKKEGTFSAVVKVANVVVSDTEFCGSCLGVSNGCVCSVGINYPDVNDLPHVGYHCEGKTVVHGATGVKVEGRNVAGWKMEMGGEKWEERWERRRGGGREDVGERFEMFCKTIEERGTLATIPGGSKVGTIATKRAVSGGKMFVSGDDWQSLHDRLIIVEDCAQVMPRESWGRYERMKEDEDEDEDEDEEEGRGNISWGISRRAG